MSFFSFDIYRNVCRDGIYPSWKSSLEIYEGAQYNLPDEAAMKTAKYIEQMIVTTMSAEDILLVLISGKIMYARNKS